MFLLGLELKKPFVIRYPKGDSVNFESNILDTQKLELGSWEVLKKGTNCAILAVGSMVELVLEDYELISNELGYQPTLVNARFVKPIDTSMMNSISSEYDTILTIEEGMKVGGFGSVILNYLNNASYSGKVKILGIGDPFIDQGSRSELLKDCGLTSSKIIDAIKDEERK